MDWLLLERDGAGWTLGGEPVESGTPVALLACAREDQADPYPGIVVGTLVLAPRRRPQLHIELASPEGATTSQANLPLAYDGVFAMRLTRDAGDLVDLTALAEAAG